MLRLNSFVGSGSVLLACLLLGGPAAPADLVAFYRADGNCLDSAHAHHGALQNGATFGAGAAGQAFLLDGVNDYVSAPDSPEWTFGDAPFTVSVRVSFNTVKSQIVPLLPNVLVGTDEGTGFQDKWVFFTDSVGTPCFHVNGPCYFFISPPTAYQPTLQEWHHYLVTRSGDTYAFYVDGVSLGTADFACTLPDPAQPLSIGQAEGLGFLDGRLDDIQIYNRALSAVEVQWLAGHPGLSVDPAPCPQDMNHDGLVDGADLGALLGAWGACSNCPADFNHDGIVDGADLGSLLGAWGACP